MANEKLKTHNTIIPDLSENEKKEIQAQFLLDTSNLFASILLKMKWILVINKTIKHFWISDNPIFRYNSHQSTLVGNLGLESPGIQLYCPITPFLTILICDPIEYKNIPNEIPAFKPNVDFQNSGQVINSRQYIYSIHDNFDLAVDMINKNPELSNPKRPRIISM